MKGCKSEIYRVPIEEGFEGINFSKIAYLLYANLRIILFAIEVKVYEETRIFLNPHDYVFPNQVHYGYVIAEAQPSKISPNKLYGIENEHREH